ncbi:sensor domain-containing diguanylate cyclase [Vibrio hippocampi]|uniref:diguanylate cyclase n=1 Tax=Vibrio hippocampi TaxID=654686 RepID=A0ABN8DMV3_9VIBR|nr:sensor domain-containing diguanylate cyclase [Vibrio hippocampi]CAH0529794.1 hypothetical protein VHP8226_03550 [Vibrio hippocampi]
MPHPEMNLIYGSAKVCDSHIVEMSEELCHLLGGVQQPTTLPLSLIDLFADTERERIDAEIALILQGNTTSQPQLLDMKNQYLGTIPVLLILNKTEWLNRPAVEMTIIDIQFTYSQCLKAREQDQMFRDMILHSAQGILVHRAFKPLFVNNSWVKLQGGDSVEQVLDMETILPLLPSHVIEGAQQRYAELIESKHPKASSVVKNIGLDGISRYFNIYDNVIYWQGELAVQVVLEDVTDKVALENQLKYQANHDDLTGLLNRRAVYSWAQDQITQHSPLTCLLMDIDNFKQINDTYGHGVGDDVIRTLSNIANETIASVGGMTGRWGGEEFIAFVPQLSMQHIQCVAQTICEKFRNTHLYSAHNQAFSATVSIGISYMDTVSEDQCLDALVQRTDRLLYTAKAKGKDRVCIKNRRHEHLLAI